jgi:hypothetical protein
MKRLLLLILFASIFLVGACGTSVVTQQVSEQPPPDTDKDGIADSIEDKLIDRFAPVVKLHSDEKYLPADVSWFIKRVKMCFDISWGPDHQLLGKGEVNINSLLSQKYHDQSSGISTQPTNFFLEQTDIDNGDSLDNFRNETRLGNLSSNWICYAHVQFAPYDHEGMYDVQYIFFYAYNGDMAWGTVESAHEADFEHITVRVENNLSNIHGIYYSAHDGEGRWYLKQSSKGVNDGYSVTSNGHPIVYSALDSHASYPWAGLWERDKLPDDYTDSNGLEWGCLNRVVNIGEKNIPNRDMDWIQYSGRWGEIGQFSWTTGPYGPAYQIWWDSDLN